MGRDFDWDRRVIMECNEGAAALSLEHYLDHQKKLAKVEEETLFLNNDVEVKGEVLFFNFKEVEEGCGNGK